METVDIVESNRLKMRHGEHIILRLTYISRYNTDNAEAAHGLMNELSAQKG
ncbi:MAG: hypothetical protein L0G63_12920 [Psychrobacter sp.]|uniref:hypothetical protein n=1 Tax=Psychrobacter sp. TaxID=56811 RepID=UPI0026487498|nr:hypothetical protein [Psychrobacter sp.]MDN5621350.1 hypothetical protein [Psychrobacter sp.]